MDCGVLDKSKAPEIITFDNNRTLLLQSSRTCLDKTMEKRWISNGKSNGYLTCVKMIILMKIESLSQAVENRMRLDYYSITDFDATVKRSMIIFQLFKPRK